MKQLVETIVKALVDSPESVYVTETTGESIVILEIRVAQEDVGKVIGKEGRIANAIRTVVKAAAAKHDKKVTVEIMTQTPNPYTTTAAPAHTVASTVTSTHTESVGTAYGTPIGSSATTTSIF